MQTEAGDNRTYLRRMTEDDREAVIAMMREFYSSDAVLSNGSDEIFNNDITACVSDSPFAEGYVFLTSDSSSNDSREQNGYTDNPLNGDHPDIHQGSDRPESMEHIAGYAMIAHSYSTEFGRPCTWIEDIYLGKEARGLGLASKFFDFIQERFPDHIHRLEAEIENVHAMDVYRRKGFEELPYVEMIRLGSR